MNIDDDIDSIVIMSSQQQQQTHHNNNTSATIAATTTTIHESSKEERCSLIKIDVPTTTSSVFNNIKNSSSSSTTTNSHHHSSLKSRLQSPICRLLFALLFVFINMNINLIVLSIIHERVPRQQPPLPDLGFDLLPKWDTGLDIAEYLIVIHIVIVSAILFMHKYRVIILRRICLILGVLYLFRAMAMASTQFPIANPNYYCSPQLNQTQYNQLSVIDYIGLIAQRVFYLSIGFGLSINGRHSYCGDYLFSGHTTILILSYLVIREYLIPTRCRTLLWKLFHLLIYLSAVMGIVAIIVSRGHYLIDILLAYYITTRIFWIYHTFCYNNTLRFKSSTNYLSRVWWWPLFRYFEGNHVINCPSQNRSNNKSSSLLSSSNSPNDSSFECNCCCDLKLPKVPRSFEWPLPWPRTLRQRLIKRRAQRLLGGGQTTRQMIDP